MGNAVIGFLHWKVSVKAVTAGTWLLRKKQTDSWQLNQGAFVVRKKQLRLHKRRKERETFANYLQTSLKKRKI